MSGDCAGGRRGSRTERAEAARPPLNSPFVLHELSTTPKTVWKLATRVSLVPDAVLAMTDPRSETPAPPPADALLRVQGVVKAYKGRRVVDGVSFHVSAGEIVGLLGPNGAGKTTSFRMTVGLTRPDAGEVWIGDRECSRLPMFPARPASEWATCRRSRASSAA